MTINSLNRKFTRSKRKGKKNSYFKNRPTKTTESIDVK